MLLDGVAHIRGEPTFDVLRRLPGQCLTCDGAAIPRFGHGLLAYTYEHSRVVHKYSKRGTSYAGNFYSSHSVNIALSTAARTRSRARCKRT